jgi:hypothetical protein
MKTVWFVVPLLVTTFGFAACANAEIYYPWCAYYGGGGQGGGTNCGWSTYEQCMVTIRGIGGFCARNPFYTPPPQKPSRHQYKQHN